MCFGDSLSVSTLLSSFCDRRTDVFIQYSACILVDNRRCPKSRACPHGPEPSSFHFSVPPLPHGWAPILVSKMKAVFDTSGAIFASLFMLLLVGIAHMEKVVHTPETNVSVVRGLCYVFAMVRLILRCLSYYLTCSLADIDLNLSLRACFSCSCSLLNTLVGVVYPHDRPHFMGARKIFRLLLGGTLLLRESYRIK